MDPIHRETALLNAALELPAVERTAFLERACGGDEPLRRQVESLIAALEEAHGFLDAPLVDLERTRADAIRVRCTEKPGDRIGRYKLIQQIGEGGCGVVYLAEQEEPVRRRVALKVIKLGMDTKSVMARFEAERQALALMDHPNIARVFDAGATELGRPYFVMEWVGGIKLTQFCDEQKISPGAKLRLFIQVCEAIQHAHQKGIIHRDIKPSNILVSVQGGRSVPKVIDFGIAKATQGRLTENSFVTGFEQFVGTPAYMSPEQTALMSADIDTRSDIYSLGVLLYELLTGRTPFDQKELLAAGLDEMRRTICTKEPVRPSARLSQELGAAEAGRHLIYVLRGDLDWIVMKCLEKDRARRYETADGLAADVLRHLKHEPVSARPPGNWYRFQKLVWRNKLAFVAYSVLAVALIIVAIGSSVAAWRVAHARQAEQSERQKAEAANRELRDMVGLLELERAEDFFREQDAAQGVAHLAAILRRDPSNHIAADRLVSALLHRDWALPAAAPMRHRAQIDLAWFSLDGNRILTASRDGTVNVWDAATGGILVTTRHRDRILQARFSPNGTRFVTASADGTAQIWNSTNGAPLGPALSHLGKVYWAEFSADGGRVVTASADRTARVWDATNGAMIRQLIGHTSPVIMARFDPTDRNRIVTGGSAGSIRLWDVDAGESLRVEDRRTNLTALAFSPDGKRLVVGCADGVARLWEVETGQQVARSLTHTEPINHAAFAPDGRLVLTTSEDSTARMWNVGTGEPFGPPLVHHGGVIFGTFSPDGRKIVTTSMDNSARFWDVSTGTPLAQPLREHERILHADFSPDGKRVVTAAYNWTARLWDVRPRRAAALELQTGLRMSSVVFSPDGNVVLTGGEGGQTRQWDARTGQVVGEPIQQRAWVHVAVYSPNGRQIVTASSSRSTHVRDAVTGQVIAGPFQHTNALWFACFSPDGGRVVTTSIDGTARVWNARDGQPITPFLQHPSAVKMARFSPDGRRLLTMSKEHARVWDTQTGAAITDPLTHIDHVNWAEFSPDGERVVTASTDNTACLWEIRTGRLSAPPLRHARSVVYAAFSPDGRRVATASIDRTARIWDSRTGQALTPALPHDRNAEALSFSPDGRRLVTIGWRGAARIWDVATGRPLTEWFDHGRSHPPAFDPSGIRVAFAGLGTHVWAVPPVVGAVPEWFITFAEGVAGLRLDAGGAAELVPGQESNEVMQRLPLDAEGDFYERLARWFLADPGKRPASAF